MIFGPYLPKSEFEYIWDVDICQFFSYGNTQLLTNSNFNNALEQLKRIKKPEHCKEQNHKFVIHMPYNCVVQQENLQQEKLEQCYQSLTLTGKLLNQAFPNSDCYIVLHMKSFRQFQLKPLLKIVNELPENVQLTFEHLACDDLLKFIKYIRPLIVEGKSGFCFDTAHMFNSGFELENIGSLPMPTLVHLNGTLKPFGCKNDIHIEALNEKDLAFYPNPDVLKLILKKWKKIPMIIEGKSIMDYEKFLKNINDKSEK